MLGMVVGVIIDHCIVGTHVRRSGLGHLPNDFCRSFSDEEENKTDLYLLGTCSLPWWSNKKTSGCDLDELNELPLQVIVASSQAPKGSRNSKELKIVILEWDSWHPRVSNQFFCATYLEGMREFKCLHDGSFLS